VPAHQCPPGVHAGDLTAWLRAKGGAAQTSMRRLALELGRSPAGVHVEIGRLAAAGVLTAAAGPRGTVLMLAAGGEAELGRRNVCKLGTSRR